MNVDMQLFTKDSRTSTSFQTDDHFNVVRKRVDQMLARHYPGSQAGLIDQDDDTNDDDRERPFMEITLGIAVTGVKPALIMWDRMLKAATGS